MQDEPYPLLKRRKTAAHNAVRSALETGRLTRPDACEGCGALGDVHGHHADYAKPLEVKWLCRLCHAAEHQAPDEWVIAAQVLRDSGMTYREIGERLGKTTSNVYKRLNRDKAQIYNKRENSDPERKKRKRAQELEALRLPERRGRCRQCGEMMGIGVQHDGVCLHCRVRRASAVEAERIRLVEMWWAEGETMREIAKRLGIPKQSLAKYMDTWRSKGAHLPYRYDMGEASKFDHLKAA